MSHPPITPRGALAIVFVALALLSGCAAPVASLTPEALVKERSMARSKFMMGGEFEKAYALTAPGYRAVIKFERFKADNVGASYWKAVDVVNVTCESAVKCTAVVKIDTRPLMGVRFGDLMTAHVEETWLQEEGQWWSFPKL